MVAAGVFVTAPVANAQDISDSAYQQIRDLLLEKESRTAVQRKLSPSLVYATDTIRGVPPGNINDLGNPATTLHLGPQGALVKIKATVSAELLSTIAQLGGRVIYSNAARGSIQARVPVDYIESLASRGDVQVDRGNVSAQSESARRSPACCGAIACPIRHRQGRRPAVSLRPVPRLVLLYRLPHQPGLHHPRREHGRANLRRQRRRHQGGHSLGFGRVPGHADRYRRSASGHAECGRHRYRAQRRPRNQRRDGDDGNRL